MFFFILIHKSYSFFNFNFDSKVHFGNSSVHELKERRERGETKSYESDEREKMFSLTAFRQRKSSLLVSTITLGKRSLMIMSFSINILEKVR
jgi:late competence protein required for DNA uptake (superfamily II DNA/RNA helicase)